ncbi:MAG: HRDC domain-containing protein [Anaerolineae bacterium]|nr:HRDC domain-containing protein [Anaerolineae bacterium]
MMSRPVSQHNEAPRPGDPNYFPEVVDSHADLVAMVDALMTQPRAAVDTEANSLYTYHERVCLIQISIPGVNYLVDPLALENLAPLAPFFHSLDVEKVFHAADYDLMVMQRDFGFATRRIYDTMWAARVLGWPKVGLADILASFFDVQANKRYQRYDWGKRPLDADALTYAWMDSYYLLPLRDLQKTELETTGRWEEAQEIFDYLTSTVEIPPDDSTVRHFWRIKGVHALHPADQRKLYHLFMWREHTAEAMDHPPVKVISNASLMRLASVQPRTREQLADCGLTPGQIRRFGTELLKVLSVKGLSEVPDQPESSRLPEDVVERFNTLKAWRKEVAQVRGVDSDVILPNATLWELAKHPPADMAGLRELPGIGPWRQKTYGPDILQLTQR